VIGALVLTGTRAMAQRDSGKVTLAVRQGDRPVGEAVVRSDGIHTQTGAGGIAILRLPVGLRQLIVAGIGFRPETIQVAMRPVCRSAFSNRVRATLRRWSAACSTVPDPSGAPLVQTTGPTRGGEFFAAKRSDEALTNS
jgi:hypothetical protein